VPAKSEVHRFAHWLPAGQMREVIDGLLKGLLDKSWSMGLKEPLDLEESGPNPVFVQNQSLMMPIKSVTPNRLAM
jgi:hypothetical protein